MNHNLSLRTRRSPSRSSRAQRRSRYATSLRGQALESRTVLAADISFDTVSRVLTINISGVDEVVELDVGAGSILNIKADFGTTATANAQGLGFAASTGGGATNSGSIAALNDVRRIDIFGSGGPQDLYIRGGTFTAMTIGATIIENVIFDTATSFFRNISGNAGANADLNVLAGTIELYSSIQTDDPVAAGDLTLDGDMVILRESVTLDADGAVDDGDVTIATRVNDGHASAHVLTVQGGAVSLGAVGTTNNLGGLTVEASGLTTLNGDISTDAVPGIGEINFSGATGGILLAASVTITSDADGNGEGGPIDLTGSAINGATAGVQSLTIIGGDRAVRTGAIGTSVALSELSISPARSIAVNGDVVVTGGVRLQAQGAIDVNGISAGGDISLWANFDSTGSADITQLSGSIVTTSESLDAIHIFTNNGDAILRSVRAGTVSGVVSIDLDDGALIDGDASAATNITAFGLSFQGNSIGTLADPFEISVTHLATDTRDFSGDQHIVEADGLSSIFLHAGATDTGGDIFLTLLAGAIQDSDSFDDIFANGVALVAPAGVGNTTNEIDLAVAAIEVDVVTGGIFLRQDESTLLIGGVTSALTGLRVQTSGDIYVYNDDDSIRLNDTDGPEVILGGSVSGNIELISDDNIGIDVNNHAITAPAGNIILDGDEGVRLGTIDPSFASNVRANGSIRFEGEDITIAGLTVIESDAFGNNTGLGIELDADDDDFVIEENASVIARGTAGGSIVILVDQNDTFRLTSANANGLVSESGDITINADKIAIGATANIDAAGDVNILPRSTVWGIELGSTLDTLAQGLELSAIELGRISAGGVLRIGSLDATLSVQYIEISDSIAFDPAKVTTLSLLTPHSIFESTASEQTDLTVQNLALQAGESVGISGSNDLDLSVSVLAAHNATSGGIVISNVGALTIGTVDGVEGITNESGDGETTVSATGPITVANNVVGDEFVGLRAINSAAPNNDITINSGVSVVSGDSGVELRAGDRVIVSLGASLIANLEIVLTGGDSETDGGGGVDLFGSLTASEIAVQGGAGADHFTLNPSFASTTIEAFGLNGNDTFIVTPNAVAPFDIDGGSPSFPVSPGDTLEVILTGATGTFFTPLGTGAGVYTFTNRQQVEFTNIETVISDDWGDAPDTYGTLKASNGPRHGLGGSTLRLGAAADSDLDGQPSANGLGDDADSDGDDEDGVTLPSTFIAGLSATITYVSSGTGFLDAWIDWNANGVFDTNEQIAETVLVEAGSNSLSVNVPANAVDGVNFARFRLSSAGNLDPTGPALDGEVEDYRVDITVIAAGTSGVFPDPNHPGQFVLIASGGTGNDSIKIDPAFAFNAVVTINNKKVLTVPYDSFQSMAVLGGNGNDVITINPGFAKPVSIYGGEGNDKITGGLGNDTIYGGGGNDTLYGYSGNDTLYGEAGKDTLYGQDGNDNLDGGLEADVLYGGNGDDTLLGAAGTDTLKGEAGNDFLSGGTEADQLLGGAGDDFLYGDGGNDTVSGEAGNDSVDGGADNDTLSGGAGSDNMNGQLGNDIVKGDDGDDSLGGGDDSDQLFGGNGNDTLNGGGGADTLKGDVGNDTLYGGTEADQLFGGVGNDSLYGEDGADTLKGEDGNDFLDGGANDDQLFGGKQNDTLLGQGGNDTLRGEDGDDSLDGGTENDKLFGDAGKDILRGGTGGDTLDGGAGNDILLGEDGLDLLNGAAGRDLLIGGGSQDTFDGGADDDILIGGTTVYDNNVVALNAILTEWGGAGTYPTRVTNLRGGAGVNLVVGADVLNDGAADLLKGNTGSDWFHTAAGDSIVDLAAGELLN